MKRRKAPPLGEIEKARAAADADCLPQPGFGGNTLGGDVDPKIEEAKLKQAAKREGRKLTAKAARGIVEARRMARAEQRRNA